MSRSRTRPSHIGGIVDRLVGSLGLSGDYHGWQIVARWPEIVGEHYARQSKALRFQDGILFVAVADAAWRQRMAMDTGKILNNIRDYPHGRVVKELRLVWGEKGSQVHGD
ncbi:MAG: DUF721 domain-containing protein [candidate division Zixibacteria bacterium]|nr:DUF721 domain-containing protein [candidate division Zixibacteria bacterium]